MSLMLQEIAEQPVVLERTIAEERPKLKRLGELLRNRDFDLIVLVARGSSDNASLFGRYLLEVTTGIPVSVAATKTYTGQMLHFYLLAAELAANNLEIDRIPDLAAKALELRPAIESIVERYVFMENCVVVGRGMNYGNSYELALKLMETCYV